jgi:general stress protein 26
MSDKTRTLERQNAPGSRAELCALLRQFRTALLVTHDPSSMPRGRPLAIARVDDDATVWFATADHSPKVLEIANDAAVAVICHRDRDEAWISLSGFATLSRDATQIRALWSVAMKPWFSGPDDPALALVRVRPARADYYDAAKPMIARAFELVKGLVTDAAPAPGTTKHVDLGRPSEPGRVSS